jgi:hypothetical protein
MNIQRVVLTIEIIETTTLTVTYQGENDDERTQTIAPAAAGAGAAAKPGVRVCRTRRANSQPADPPTPTDGDAIEPGGRNEC